MLQRILGIGSGSSSSSTVDDLSLRRVIKQEEMSGQPVEYSTTSWQTAPPSTSVTGTSELFSSTFAMLSDNTAYDPNQWSLNKAPLTQSILFEQPQIQPISSSFDPPVRFDPPYAYRQQQQQHATYANNLTQHYYIQQQPQPQQQQQQIRVTYAPSQQQQQQQQQAQQSQQQQQQFYQPPTSTIIASAPQTQQLLMAPSPVVMRPEPLRPTNNAKVEHRKSPQVSRQQSNTVSPCDDVSLSSPGLTSSGSAASATPPLNANDMCGSSSTDLEGPDEERVMCIACRGVYPSRRSLTGHIGRNEKCREIIGRNYLDAVASGVNPPIPGTDAAIKSGAITTGQDGMSPVCPFCDRFISHYKGNIRRHINQCCKNTEPIKRPNSGEMDKNNKLKRRKTEDGFHQPDFNDYDGMGMMNGAPISPQSSSYYGGSSDLCSPNSGGANGGGSSGANGSGASYSNYEGFHTPQKNGPKREQAPPDDAYICEDCDFVTVYKGNMKRHLNTCHPVTDCKNLKVVEWDMKLESMRASNMGIVGDRLQEKLALHKQNSSRGRKPRKKKENQNSEESEPLIEEYKPTISNMPDSYVTYAQ